MINMDSKSGPSGEGYSTMSAVTRQEVAVEELVGESSAETLADVVEE
jgi:hypothetical protein